MLNQSTRSGYVYLIGSMRFGWFKIGMAKTCHIRIKQIGVLLPFTVHLLAIWQTSDRRMLEVEMHKRYTGNHLNGEWFSFSGEEAAQVVLSQQPADAIRVFPEKDELSYRKISSSVKKDVTVPMGMKKILKRTRAKQYMERNGIEPSTANMSDIYRTVLAEIKSETVYPIDRS